MNILKNIKPQKKIMLIISALLLTAVLAWFFRDLVRKTIVVVILYVLWVIDRVLQTIPQPILWMLFITFISIILVKSLFIPKKSQQKRWKSASAHSGRVTELARLIHFARNSEYSRWKLAHSLVGLASQIMTLSKQCPIEQIHKQLQTESMGLEKELQEYFKAGLTKTTKPQTGWLSKMLRQQKQSKEPDSPLDLEPECIVQYLEDQLKIIYENEHR